MAPSDAGGLGALLGYGEGSDSDGDVAPEDAGARAETPAVERSGSPPPPSGAADADLPAPERATSPVAPPPFYTSADAAQVDSLLRDLERRGLLPPLPVGRPAPGAANAAAAAAAVSAPPPPPTSALDADPALRASFEAAKARARVLAARARARAAVQAPGPPASSDAAPGPPASADAAPGPPASADAAPGLRVSTGAASDASLSTPAADAAKAEAAAARCTSLAAGLLANVSPAARTAVEAQTLAALCRVFAARAGGSGALSWEAVGGTLLAALAALDGGAETEAAVGAAGGAERSGGEGEGGRGLGGTSSEPARREADVDEALPPSPPRGRAATGEVPPLPLPIDALATSPPAPPAPPEDAPEPPPLPPEGALEPPPFAAEEAPEPPPLPPEDASEPPPVGREGAREPPGGRTSRETLRDLRSPDGAAAAPRGAGPPAKRAKKARAGVKVPKPADLGKAAALVARWAKAREETRAADSEEDDDEIARTRAAEDWRLGQIRSGATADNPNFAPLAYSWEDRIRGAAAEALGIGGRTRLPGAGRREGGAVPDGPTAETLPGRSAGAAPAASAAAAVAGAPYPPAGAGASAPDLASAMAGAPVALAAERAGAAGSAAASADETAVPAASGSAAADAGPDAPPSSSAALPPGWVEAQDPSSGLTYYANPETGESRWDRPT